MSRETEVQQWRDDAAWLREAEPRLRQIADRAAAFNELVSEFANIDVGTEVPDKANAAATFAVEVAYSAEHIAAVLGRDDMPAEPAETQPGVTTTDIEPDSEQDGA